MRVLKELTRGSGGCLAVMLLVLVAGDVALGRAPSAAPKKALPIPSKEPSALFDLVARPCNHTQPAQLMTTDEHTQPHTEAIYIGGLPCLPDHCHVQ